MAIKIVRSNYSIEVTTEEDLRLVLKALDNHQLVMPIDLVTPPQPQGDSQEPFKKFWANIRSKKSLALVQALISAKDGLTDAEIRGLLGLTNNLELAGVIRGVAFAARRSDLSLSKIWQKEESGKGSSKTLQYRLRRNVRQALADAQGRVTENTPAVAGS